MIVRDSIHNAAVTLFISKKYFIGKLFSSMLFALLSFFNPIAPYLVGVFFMIVIDMITGILAAKAKIKRKRERGEEVTDADRIRSRRLEDTVAKMTLFLLAIVSAEIFRKVFLSDIEKHLGITAIPLSMFVAGAVAFTELQSLRENIKTARGIDILYVLDVIVPEKIKSLFSETKNKDDVKPQ